MVNNKGMKEDRKYWGVADYNFQFSVTGGFTEKVTLEREEGMGHTGMGEQYFRQRGWLVLHKGPEAGASLSYLWKSKEASGKKMS